MSRLLVLAFCLVAGCATPGPVHSVPTAAADAQTIERFLDVLYETFSFGPESECDWPRMRSLFDRDALFVQSPRGGERPRMMNPDEFIADFKDFIASSGVSATGLYERTTHRHVERYGKIAHVFVVFEGRYDPTSVEPDTRGVDSIQLWHHSDRWWLVSFSTQFESATMPIPARFLRPAEPDQQP